MDKTLPGQRFADDVAMTTESIHDVGPQLNTIGDKNSGFVLLSRVSDQNGVSLLIIILELGHFGWEPSIYKMQRKKEKKNHRLNANKHESK